MDKPKYFENYIDMDIKGREKTREVRGGVRQIDSECNHASFYNCMFDSN